MARIRPAEAVGIWQTEIALRVERLRNRLNTAVAHYENGHAKIDGLRPEEFDARVAAVKGHLDDAYNTYGKSPRRPRAKRIRGWWTGETITAAWDSVHAAEAELVAIEPRDHVLAPIPVLRLWMRQVLGDAVKLEAYERALEKIGRSRGALDRAFLRQVYRDTIEANSEWHKGLRAFRNILFVVAAGLAIVIVVIGTWHAIDPSFVSLCSDGGAGFCFGDGPRSTRDAVFQVALIGAAGGLLSLAFPLGKTEHAPSRFNLLAPQIVLKVLAGAVTALLGVLLVQSQFVSLVKPESTAGLLAYAAAFGFSQQLLTQIIDKRAGDLLESKRS